jgi:hypothetical protein
MTEQDARPNMPLPVLVTPQPSRVGPWRLAVAGVAAIVIVTLVLYGVSRPPEPTQTAAASQASQPAEGASNGQPAGGSAPGQTAKPQSARQGKPQPSTPQPSTTGAAPGEQSQQPKQAPAASQNRSESATDRAPADKAPAKK